MKKIIFLVIAVAAGVVAFCKRDAIAEKFDR